MRPLWYSVRQIAVGFRDGIVTFLEVTRPILRPFFPAFRVVMVLLALQILIQSIYPLIYGRLTDALVARNSRLSLLLFGVLIFQGIVHHLIAYKRDLYEIDHIDWAMNLQIMTESLEHMTGFSLAQSSAMHSGKARDIVRKGRLAIRHLVYMFLYQVGTVGLTLTLALVCLFFISPLIGGVAIVGTLVYATIRLSLFMRHREPMKALDNRDNENGKYFADVLTNMEVVMAYARQRLTVADFDADGRQLVRQAQEFWRPAAGWYFVSSGVAFISKYTMMGMTAWLLFRDMYTFGTYVAITQWAMMTVSATQELGNMQREISSEWAHAELYLQLLHKPPEIVSPADAFRPESLRGNIAFENVTFNYEPRASDDPLKAGEPVTALNNVTFEIPSGQKIALVGESGAGKSTVAYALMRARDPQTGIVRVDGTDLKTLDLDAVRRRIGYVSQQPRLFDRTLRYNLLFGLNDNGTASDDQLRKLLAMVKLDHLADNGGLDRKLGENGHTLSGGERQRLCIARALIKNPDVLIFDEATSSLDPVNERKVQDAIDAARGRTKIIIAHRYSTIRDVDRILVFESGRLVDDGTHDELSACCPYYHMLLEQQGLL